MKIYVYSDESGVLDKKHEDYFVFGGVIFLSKESRDNASRRFISAENNIRISEGVKNWDEVKACHISNKSKLKLYKSMKDFEKFGVIISQKDLHDKIFDNKKTKQRYLDWAFKMAVKTKFIDLINRGLINPNEVNELYFFADEHTTATNGKYELKESLENEFKNGSFDFNWHNFHKPLFTNLNAVNLQYCNSAKKSLIRSADIVANRLYYLAKVNNDEQSDEKLTIYKHPIKK